MKQSFNAYGVRRDSYGVLHIPIWLGTVRPVPVGGTLDAAYNINGLYLRAGAPINITGQVIKPFIAFEVVSFSAATGSETDDVIVIKPASLGVEMLPKVDDLIQKVGATFAATGKAAKVKAVTALTGSDAGKYAVTVLHSATVDSVTAGDFIAISAATSAGSSKSLAVIPNAYLYEDINLADLPATGSDVFATGAAVKFHGEGILIDRTDSAPFAAQMAAAVPGVLQVAE